VDEGFEQAVLARELLYPTGLPLPDIPVAIPHTEAGHCASPALAVGILSHPVEFGEMGAEAGCTLQVQIVFVLALNDPKKQVEWLQRLVLFFQKPGLLAQLKQSPDPASAAELLRAHL